MCRDCKLDASQALEDDTNLNDDYSERFHVFTVKLKHHDVYIVSRRGRTVPSAAGSSEDAEGDEEEDETDTDVAIPNFLVSTCLCVLVYSM